MDIQAQINDFRKKIFNERVVLIQHHTDLDGYASGYICREALSRRNVYTRIRPGSTGKIISGKTILVTDIPFETPPHAEKTYAIDHHKWKVIPNNVVAVNPHYTNTKNPHLWNAGLLSFMTFKEEVRDKEWVAAVSVVADKCEGDHVPINMNYNSLHDVAHKLSAVLHFPGKEKLVYRYFKMDYENVRKEKTLEKYASIFDRELEKYDLSEAVFADENKKFAVIEVRSNLRKMKSAVANYISEKHPEWVIITYQRGKICNVSLRCGSNRIYLGKICAENPFGSGGGHPPAAAARVPGSKLKKFIEYVYSKLNTE